MTRVIAVSNLKGGSAKTTTTVTVGAEFAVLGWRVLLIDVDGQGHLAEAYGIQAMSVERDMSDVLEGSVPLQHVIRPLRPNLFLAPSNLRLANLEPHLISSVGRENKLRKALKPLLGEFDMILIDCPPSVGIYTVNAFAAASEVLVPMTAEFFALTGVSMLLDSLAKLRAGLEHDIKVTGIVPTRVTRTVNARDVVDQAKAQLGNNYRFFTGVPESVAVREATVAGQPVTEYAPDNPASVAYRQVAKEIFDGKG
jgi:chromosome partitioning protein